MRYCFRHAATCKEPGTAMAFRTGDEPWTQMVVPDGFLIGYRIPPEVDGTRIVLGVRPEHLRQVFHDADPTELKRILGFAETEEPDLAAIQARYAPGDARSGSEPMIRR